jgi:hypothetical protein
MGKERSEDQRHRFSKPEACTYKSSKNTYSGLGALGWNENAFFHYRKMLNFVKYFFAKIISIFPFSRASFQIFTKIESLCYAKIFQKNVPLLHIIVFSYFPQMFRCFRIFFKQFSRKCIMHFRGNFREKVEDTNFCFNHWCLHWLTRGMDLGRRRQKCVRLC